MDDVLIVTQRRKKDSQRREQTHERVVFMRTFLINGKQVTGAEWRRIENAFAAIGAAPAAYMRDNILVADEVSAMLDLDSDGHCSLEDLTRLNALPNGAKRFGDVSSILGTYGLSWSQIIDDWLYPTHSVQRSYYRLPEYVQSDKGIATAVVQRSDLKIEDLSPIFMSDKDVVLAAAHRSLWSFGHTAPQLLKDRTFALEAVRKNGDALAYMPSFKDDDEIVLNAVQQNGDALGSASERLRDNDKIVLAAVRNSGGSLVSASRRLQANRKIVLESIRHSERTPYELPSWKYASSELRANRTVALTAVRQNGRALGAAAPALRSDRTLVLAAIHQNGNALQYAAPELQDDAEVVLTAVRNRGEALEFASPRLRADHNTVLSALQNNWTALRYVPPPLRDHPDLVAEALLININVIDHMGALLDKATLAKAWPVVVGRLTAEGLHLPVEAQKGVDEFFTALKALNITHHGDRFQSLRTLITVWNNRISQPPPNKPIALLLYAATDKRSMFATEAPIPDALVADGRWHVQYFEVNREEQVWKIMRDVSREGKTPIHTLVLAGPGRFDALKLSAENLDMSSTPRTDWMPSQEEGLFLDVGDFAQGDFAPLRKYLAKNGQVLLPFGEAGAGGKYKLNLANALARQAPAGVHFLSSRQNVTYDGLKIGADMSLQPEWTTGYHFRTPVGP